MKGRYKFRFGWPSFKRSATIYETTSRPMTEAEKQAFDKVFDKMRETFDAMDDFFKESR
jgi:malate/lactate dehydrogenase